MAYMSGQVLFEGLDNGLSFPEERCRNSIKTLRSSKETGHFKVGVFGKRFDFEDRKMSLLVLIFKLDVAITGVRAAGLIPW
jgi:hypothetical protein